MSINTLILSVVSVLFGGLLTMILAFLQALRRDVHDLVTRLDKQEARITDVQIVQARMQEQVYTLLRGQGAPSSHQITAPTG